MTPRREELIRVIAGYWERNGYAPTFREIAKAMGYASTQPVAYHLGLLRDQGVVTYTEGLARTIRVVGSRSGEHDGEGGE